MTQIALRYWYKTLDDLLQMVVIVFFVVCFLEGCLVNLLGNVVES
jgi:hypothetical protein